ncbi:MAG: HEPN domain-containing protein [Calditrichaeota bacterium]|nr:MAG: HEPN domain-containing protein [Calditrichota bacterium]
MNEIVREWIQKAEGDYHSALREYRARKFPNFDAAGFHAQQCIEKYLKAFLQLHQLPFQKTHDLLALQHLCSNVLPELEFYRDLLAYLSQFAIVYRYPGENATKEQAKKAIQALKQLRSFLREKLNLPKEEG